MELGLKLPAAIEQSQTGKWKLCSLGDERGWGHACIGDLPVGTLGTINRWARLVLDQSGRLRWAILYLIAKAPLTSKRTCLPGTQNSWKWALIRTWNPRKRQRSPMHAWCRAYKEWHWIYRLIIADPEWKMNFSGNESFEEQTRMGD